MKVIGEFLHFLFLLHFCSGFIFLKMKQTNQTTNNNIHISDTNNFNNFNHSLFRMKRNPYYSMGSGSQLYPILDASVTILSFAAFASLFTMAISRFIMNRGTGSTSGSTGGDTGTLGPVVSLGQKKNMNITGNDNYNDNSNDNGDGVIRMLNQAEKACIEWQKCMRKNFYATKNKLKSQECPRRPRSCSLSEIRKSVKPDNMH